jgi:Cu-Zn family superoxide dismutase
MIMKRVATTALAVSLWAISAQSSTAAESTSIEQAVAVMHPTTGNQCRGVVHFSQEGDALTVVADLEGLNPGQKHAFHIHEFGDCTAPDGTSAGGHYNPEGHQHGVPEATNRHAGDLGNVQANSSGTAHYKITVTNLSIQGSKNPILGRAVIVHAKPDDGSQPVGGAGARIACGVIGLANPGK